MWVTVEEAGRRLALKPVAVRRLLQAGKLVGRKLPREHGIAMWQVQVGGEDDTAADVGDVTGQDLRRLDIPELRRQKLIADTMRSRLQAATERDKVREEARAEFQADLDRGVALAKALVLELAITPEQVTHANEVIATWVKS